jgi:hypothetical protein
MIHRIGTIGPNLHLEDSVSARTADPLDRDANIGQVLSEPRIIDGEVNVIANPLWRKFHDKLPVASFRY